jgi:hypothetical protein
MVRPEYTRIPTDAISDDSSIIDFDNVQNRNTGLDNDDYVSDYDMPLLANNTNTFRNIRSARMQPIPFTNSSSLRNSLIKKLYWNMCVIILASVIPYTLIIYSYIEMKNSHGIDIYNLSSEYMYNYFLAIMLFYTIYIGITFIILFLAFCLSINYNTIGFALLVNNMLFQTNVIFRIVAIAILAVRMIDNTPMNIITIDKANPPTQVEVYIPKHIQFMIIETVLYAVVNYLIGESSGIIKMLITY